MKRKSNVIQTIVFVVIMVLLVTAVVGIIVNFTKPKGSADSDQGLNQSGSGSGSGNAGGNQGGGSDNPGSNVPGSSNTPGSPDFNVGDDEPGNEPEVATYTLTFELISPGGYTETFKTFTEVKENAKIVAPIAPEQTGYVFDGWFTGNDFKEKFDFEKGISADTTVYGGYTRTYTVSFDLDGGEPQINSITGVRAGSKIEMPKFSSGESIIPEKPGYEFSYWGTLKADNEGNFKLVPWDFKSDIVTEDIILTAGYVEAELLTVSFWIEDSLYSKVEVNKGKSVEAPKVEERDGYVFDGWYDTAYAPAQKYNFSDPVETYVTLKGYYIEIVTVSFDVEGDTSKVAAQTIKMGDKAENKTPAAPIGKVFDGWYTGNDFATKYDFETTVRGDMTLYGRFVDSETFTVTFNTNGSAAIEPITNVKRGEKIKIPSSPEKDGYFFDGWYKDENYTEIWDFIKDVVESDVTLYAKFTKLYTIDFYVDKELYKSVQVREGDYLDSGMPEKREGYDFYGWFTDETYKTLYTFDSELSGPVKKSFTLYGYYELIPTTKYTVTFEIEGYTVSPQEVTVDDYATQPNVTPTKANYAFDGWFTSAEGGVKWNFNSDKVTSDMTLYGRFVRTYIVTFNVSGDTTLVAAQTIKEGHCAGQPYLPKRSGYEFDGWYDSAQLSSKYNFATPIKADTTIYGQFVKLPEEEVYVTVNYYDEADPIIPLGTQNVKIGDRLRPPVNLPGNADPDKFAWHAWFTSSGVYIDASTAIATGNVDLYGHYCPYLDGKNGLYFLHEAGTESYGGYDPDGGTGSGTGTGDGTGDGTGTGGGTGVGSGSNSEDPDASKPVEGDNTPPSFGVGYDLEILAEDNTAYPVEYKFRLTIDGVLPDYASFYRATLQVKQDENSSYKTAVNFYDSDDWFNDWGGVLDNSQEGVLVVEGNLYQLLLKNGYADQKAEEVAQLFYDCNYTDSLSAYFNFSISLDTLISASELEPESMNALYAGGFPVVSSRVTVNDELLLYVHTYNHDYNLEYLELVTAEGETYSADLSNKPYGGYFSFPIASSGGCTLRVAICENKYTDLSQNAEYADYDVMLKEPALLDNQVQLHYVIFENESGQICFDYYFTNLAGSYDSNIRSDGFTVWLNATGNSTKYVFPVGERNYSEHACGWFVLPSEPAVIVINVWVVGL